MEKLSWVEKIIVKELYAPYVVEKDEDYYKDLSKKFSMLNKLAEEAGADKESLAIIKNYTEKTKESIKSYYDGSISKAHRIIKNLVKGCENEKLAVNA